MCGRRHLGMKRNEYRAAATDRWKGWSFSLDVRRNANNYSKIYINWRKFTKRKTSVRNVNDKTHLSVADTYKGISKGAGFEDAYWNNLACERVNEKGPGNKDRSAVLGFDVVYSTTEIPTLMRRQNLSSSGKRISNITQNLLNKKTTVSLSKRVDLHAVDSWCYFSS